MFSKRKSLRLKEYDYSRDSAYFVTICTHNRQRLFGEICRGDPCGRPEVKYTQLGMIAKNTFCSIEEKYNIQVLQYVIMPDHIHAIILIENNYTESETGDRKGRPYRRCSLPQVMGAYKSIVSNEWLKICRSENILMGKIWQRSFFDHIIRDSHDMQIRLKYIYDNPLKWWAENAEL